MVTPCVNLTYDIAIPQSPTSAMPARYPAPDRPPHGFGGCQAEGGFGGIKAAKGDGIPNGGTPYGGGGCINGKPGGIG